MRKIVKAAAGVAMGAAMVFTASPAQAADVAMRNNPATYAYGHCGGNVVMNYFYTTRSDIYSATYYDEYRKSDGTWLYGGKSITLHDSESGNFTMITSLLNGTPVRVRANHYVDTRQGPGCSQA